MNPSQLLLGYLGTAFVQQSRLTLHLYLIATMEK